MYTNSQLTDHIEVETLLPFASISGNDSRSFDQRDHTNCFLEWMVEPGLFYAYQHFLKLSNNRCEVVEPVSGANVNVISWLPCLTRGSVWKTRAKLLAISASASSEHSGLSTLTLIRLSSDPRGWMLPTEGIRLRDVVGERAGVSANEVRSEDRPAGVVKSISISFWGGL